MDPIGEIELHFILNLGFLVNYHLPNTFIEFEKFNHRLLNSQKWNVHKT